MGANWLECNYSWRNWYCSRITRSYQSQINSHYTHYIAFLANNAVHLKGRAKKLIKWKRKQEIKLALKLITNSCDFINHDCNLFDYCYLIGQELQTQIWSVESMSLVVNQWVSSLMLIGSYSLQVRNSNKRLVLFAFWIISKQLTRIVMYRVKRILDRMLQVIFNLLFCVMFQSTPCLSTRT